MVVLEKVGGREWINTYLIKYNLKLMRVTHRVKKTSNYAMLRKVGLHWRAIMC